MVAGGCGAAAHPRTARVEHVVSNGRAEDLKAAELGSVAATGVSGGLEDELWLVPVEDRRGLASRRSCLSHSGSHGSAAQSPFFLGSRVSPNGVLFATSQRSASCATYLASVDSI